MLVLLYIVKLIIVMVALKAIIGFHFPWEKCSCCGRRLDKNHVNTKNIYITRDQINRDTDETIKKWDKWEKKNKKRIK